VQPQVSALVGKFTEKELNDAKAPGEEGRTIEGVADLTFDEYARLIENERRWKKLALEIDRVEFVTRLKKIREVRNECIFDPDGFGAVRHGAPTRVCTVS
jgi:hypothetical protein